MINMKKQCTNCDNLCNINEYVNHCSNCGKIFTEVISIMSDEKIKEKTTIRRTGKDVDKLDG